MHKLLFYLQTWKYVLEEGHWPLTDKYDEAARDVGPPGNVSIVPSVTYMST